MHHSNIVCLSCGERHPKGTLYSCNKCGGILDAEYNYDEISVENVLQKFKKGRSIWRFRDLLPVGDDVRPVSLGKGNTPLLHADKIGHILGMSNIFLKDESRNPTGSFKDRALSVGITCAVEKKVQKVRTASSGNAAASASAYSANAGLSLYLLFDANSPPTKHLQPLVYGGKGLGVKDLFSGDSIDLIKMLMTLSEKLGAYNVFCWSLVNPYTIEGLKTCAYEICEELQWKSPDVVIVPVGGGDNLVGQWKGYKEMHRLGLVNNKPRMIGVQSSSADPLTKAWRTGSSRVNSISSATSIASGINVPYSGDHALSAIKESNGAAVSVDDEDIVRAEKDLAIYEGVWVEPSSSTVIAALPKILAEGLVDKDETKVCVLTGSGLKDMKTAKLIVQQTEIVDKEIEKIISAFEKNYP